MYFSCHYSPPKTTRQIHLPPLKHCFNLHFFFFWTQKSTHLYPSFLTRPTYTLCPQFLLLRCSLKISAVIKLLRFSWKNIKPWVCCVKFRSVKYKIEGLYGFLMFIFEKHTCLRTMIRVIVCLKIIKKFLEYIKIKLCAILFDLCLLDIQIIV